MRREILVFFLVILFATQISCSLGKIIIKDDEFTKSKTITMYLKPSIREWSQVILMLWENEFYREMKDGKSTATTVFVTLYGAGFLSKIEKKAMIKINDNVYDVPVMEAETETTIGNTTVELEKSPGRPNTYTGTGQTSQGKKYRMKLNLTPQIEREMANASAVTLRFNIENQPISIVYSGSEVEKLKDFMTLDPYKVD